MTQSLDWQGAGSPPRQDFKTETLSDRGTILVVIVACAQSSDWILDELTMRARQKLSAAVPESYAQSLASVIRSVNATAHAGEETASVLLAALDGPRLAVAYAGKASAYAHSVDSGALRLLTQTSTDGVLLGEYLHVPVGMYPPSPSHFIQLGAGDRIQLGAGDRIVLIADATSRTTQADVESVIKKRHRSLTTAAKKISKRCNDSTIAVFQYRSPDRTAQTLANLATLIAMLTLLFATILFALMITFNDGRTLDTTQDESWQPSTATQTIAQPKLTVTDVSTPRPTMRTVSISMVETTTPRPDPKTQTPLPTLTPTPTPTPTVGAITLLEPAPGFTLDRSTVFVWSPPAYVPDDSRYEVVFWPPTEETTEKFGATESLDETSVIINPAQLRTHDQRFAVLFRDNEALCWGVRLNFIEQDKRITLMQDDCRILTVGSSLR